eukprot:2327927-Amphidinium_carterae.1
MELRKRMMSSPAYELQVIKKEVETQKADLAGFQIGHKMSSLFSTGYHVKVVSSHLVHMSDSVPSMFKGNKCQ